MGPAIDNIESDDDGIEFLSLIAPNEWNKSEYFIGTFVLNHDNKWIKR